MRDLPEPVRAYLHSLLWDRARPAWLHICKAGEVLASGGELESHGLNELRSDLPLDQQLPLFAGLLPVTESLVLEGVSTDRGGWSDLHLFPDDGGAWAIFIDTSAEISQQRDVQQRGNELSLQRDRQARQLEQYLGREVATQLAEGLLQIREEGERRDLTVLFADIRGFTAFSEGHPPEMVFRSLNLYLRAMIQPVLDGAGMIDKIMGDAVMAIFGLLPTDADSVQQALKAATRMLEGVAEVGRLPPRGEPAADLRIGVGIATGPVAVGILGSRQRRSFSAIGHHVNLAARLEHAARAGEILIDEATYSGAAAQRAHFSPVQLQLPGLGAAVAAYSFLQEA